MKTLPVQFLKRSNWLIAAMSIGCMGMVLSNAVVHAQVPTTCADLQWPTGKGIQSQLPLNSPGAGKPTVVDSLASKAEAAQKKAHLTCDAKHMQSWVASRKRQASCAQQLSVTDPGKLKILTNLPTLGEAVQQLKGARTLLDRGVSLFTLNTHLAGQFSGIEAKVFSLLNTLSQM